MNEDIILAKIPLFPLLLPILAKQGLDGNSLTNSIRLQTHDIFDLFSVNTGGSYSNSYDQVAIIQHPTGFLTSESGLRGFTFKLRAFIVEASARSEPAFAEHVIREFFILILSMIFLLFYLAFNPTSALPFSERDIPLNPPYFLPFDLQVKAH